MAGEILPVPRFCRRRRLLRFRRALQRQRLAACPETWATRSSATRRPGATTLSPTRSVRPRHRPRAVSPGPAGRPRASRRGRASQRGSDSRGGALTPRAPQPLQLRVCLLQHGMLASVSPLPCPADHDYDSLRAGHGALRRHAAVFGAADVTCCVSYPAAPGLGARPIRTVRHPNRRRHQGRVVPRGQRRVLPRPAAEQQRHLRHLRHLRR